MSHAQRVVQAVGWNAAGTGARVVVQFGSSVVLARLLGPTAFGIVAAAMVVTALGALIAEGGLGAGLIAREHVTDEDVARVQLLQLLVAGGLVLGLWAGRRAIAELMHIRELAAVLPIIALQFPLQAVGATSNALLKRQMNFRAIQMAQTTAYMVGYVGVGIATAVAGWGVWSLVLAQLVFVACNSVLLCVQCRRWPRMSPALPSRSLVRYGLSVTFSNLGTWLNGSIDTAIVGRLFGAHILGFYSRASSLVSNPATLVVSLVQSALFPAFAQAKTRNADTATPFLAGYGATLLGGLGVALFVALHADPIVRLLFGTDWMPAAPLLAILVFAVVSQCVVGMTSALLWGYHRVGDDIRGHVAGLATVLGALALGLMRSPAAIAVVMVCAGAVRALILTSSAARALRISATRLAALAARAVLVALVIVGATEGTRYLLESAASTTPVARVAFDGAASVIALGFVLLIAPRLVLTRELRLTLGRVLPPRPAGAVWPRFLERLTAA